MNATAFDMAVELTSPKISASALAAVATDKLDDDDALCCTILIRLDLLCCVLKDCRCFNAA